MKKILSLTTLLTMSLVLTACGETEVEECVPEVIEKEVVKYVDNIIKKEVPIEVPVYNTGVFEYQRLYKPGTYFKSSQKDKDGNRVYAFVVIDDYGRISGVYFDSIVSKNRYKYDSETEKLYLRVEGIEDIIPNTYRLVDLDKDLPTIEDPIRTCDLIEGYPEYDSVIRLLKDVKTCETANVLSGMSVDFENSYTYKMNKVSKKIVEDQTTLGINLYQSGDNFRTDTIKDLDIPIGTELGLVQDILDNEAKLDDKTSLKDLPTGLIGLYKPGTYISTSSPIVENGVVTFNTSAVVVDEFGNIAGAFMDETSPSGTRYLDNQSDKEVIDSILTEIKNNQGISLLEYCDEAGEKTELSFKKDTNYDKKAYFENTKLVANGLIESVSESLDKSNGIKPVKGVYYNHDDKGNFVSIVVDEYVTGYDFSKLEGYKSYYKDLEKAVKELLETEYIVDEYYRNTGAKAGVKININYNGTNAESISFVDYTHLNDNNVLSVNDLVKYEPRIVSINLDSVEEANQARLELDGKQYDLYVYDRGMLDLALEETKVPTVIYKNGDSYCYTSGDRKLDGFKLGDKVKFDYPSFDERATVRPLKAYSTSLALNKAKAKELKEFSNKFIGISKFDILDFDQVSENEKAYYDLIVKTLINATKEKESSSNVLVLDDLAHFNVSPLGRLNLGNGTYTVSEQIPNADGTYKFSTIHVVDDKLAYLLLDETIVNDDKLSTKTILDENYHVDKELNESTNQEDKTFKEEISEVEKDILHHNKNLFKDYDYELNSNLEEDEDLFSNDQVIYSWNSSLEKLVLVALQERIDSLEKQLIESIDKQLKDQYIVASDPKDAGAVSIIVKDSDLFLGEVDDKKYYLEFDLDEVSKDLDITSVRTKADGSDALSEADKVATKYLLAVEAEDITNSTIFKFNVNLQFDKYDEVNLVKEIGVLNDKEYKDKMLNSKFNEVKINELLSGTSLTTELKGLEEESRLGSVDKDGFVMVSNLEKVKLAFTNAKYNLTNGSLSNISLFKKFTIGTNDVVVPLNGGSITLKANKELKVAFNEIANTYEMVVQGTPSDSYTLSGVTLENALIELMNRTFIEDNAGKLVNYKRGVLVNPSASGANLSIGEYDVTFGKDLNNKLEITEGETDYIISTTGVTINKKNVLATAEEKQALAKMMLYLEKGVTYPLGVEYTVLTTESKANANDEDKTIGEFTIKTFFDAYDQEKEYLRTYQRGEASKENTFKVYGKTAYLKEAKLRNTLASVKNNKTSDEQLIDLALLDDLKLNGPKLNYYGTTNVLGRSLEIPVANMEYIKLDNEYIKALVFQRKAGENNLALVNEKIYLIDSNNVATLKDSDFTNVTMTFKNYSGADIAFATTENVSLNDLLRYLSFYFVKDDESLKLKVASQNDNSVEVNLTCDFGVGRKDFDFTVSKSSEKLYSKRLANSILNKLNDQFKLSSYIDYGELAPGADLVIKPEYMLVDDIFVTAYGSTEEKKVELYYFLENGKQLRDKPRIGQVLANQTKDLEVGKSKDIKIIVFAYYDIDGKEQVIRLDLDTRVYRNN